jgi:hypothetical protein
MHFCRLIYICNAGLSIFNGLKGLTKVGLGLSQAWFKVFYLRVVCAVLRG